MKELIKKLSEAFGPAGFEDPVRELIAVEVKELADDVRVDAMGNLFAFKRGQDSGKRVMLAAHMDEIGVMAAFVDEKGFVRLSCIGFVPFTGLKGSRVQFVNGVVGIIDYSETLADIVKLEAKKPEYDKLTIDVGADSRASCPVKVGDPAHFARPFVDMGNGRLVCKSMDDRIGCAVLIETLRRLMTPAYDTYFVFTVQEEVGIRGAVTSAYGVAPDMALAVDVTPVYDVPDAHPMPVTIGGGAAIKVKDSGMIAHPKLKDWLVKVAEENDIRYQLEVLELGSTDGRAVQLSREGVVTGVVSIPCRHIHTPSEMVDLGDVEQCVALLAAVLSKPIELG